MSGHCSSWRRVRACVVGAAALVGVAHAAPPALEPSGTVPPGLRDPWVPPAVRKAAASGVSPSPSGAALKAQVLDKLRASFDRADVERVGSITREQARAAGLGLVVARFDAIDTAAAGRIAFEDFVRFLRAQGADL